MSTLTLTVTVIPNSGPNPLTVYCSSAVSGGFPPYAYDWNFGDGTPHVHTPNAVHTFPAGTFTVTLTVTDSDMFQVEESATVTVSAAIPPATFTPLSDQMCVATNPGPLAAIAAPLSLQQIPSGNLELVPIGGTYDRCLGEFIGTDGVPIPMLVNSVTNSDGTLTISPTTGAVGASLNLASANAWTAAQAFNAAASVKGGLTADSVTIDVGTHNSTPILALHARGPGPVAAYVWYYDNQGPLVFIDRSVSALTVAAGLGTAIVMVNAGYTFAVAAISSTSDSRLKDFSPFAGDPLAELDAVRVGSYRHMGLPGQMVDLGSVRAGVAAETLPPTVNEYDRDGWAHVRLPDYEAWLTGVCKALRAEVSALRTEIEKIRGAS
jgi:hypothetical protein